MTDNPHAPHYVSCLDRCGARTRWGEPCKSVPVTGRRRCRMHGGAAGSGAPFETDNFRHGRYTKEIAAVRLQNCFARSGDEALLPSIHPPAENRVLISSISGWVTPAFRSWVNSSRTTVSQGLLVLRILLTAIAKIERPRLVQAVKKHERDSCGAISCRVLRR
ncbi:HGGxSTG domain-containing protein [Bradyrhizobium liaoningense]|uniref:HGGxSTG domain-containing protein n=1 Tax=Bradyrhizobium liaoningense TaxID=43992 RepID=UPI0024C06FFC|nr:HGGxSTG domain-containing protein [Bradyrhizobium liaoningense]